MLLFEAGTAWCHHCEGGGAPPDVRGRDGHTGQAQSLSSEGCVDLAPGVNVHFSSLNCPVSSLLGLFLLTISDT